MESPFEPAGDQPQAIEKLVQVLQHQEGKAVLEGVTGSGKTMTMASVIARLGRPTLVITHNKTLAAQLYRELKTFFPHNAVEYFISYYDYYQPEAYLPTTDTFIEKDAAVNDEIERLRLQTTSSLLERNDVIVVASVSCIYGLGSPEDYSESVLLLRVGEPTSREDTIKALLHMRYERNDMQIGNGMFRVRGEVIEIMPAYANDSIRLEFFEDELEGISKIDKVTGKSKERFDRTAIYPAKHFITSPPKLKEAVENIKNEMKEQVDFFLQQKKHLEAERVQQRTLYDMEMLKEMGYCSGIENYSRHLTQREEGSRPACLLDYFPQDFLIVVDESHVTIPQIGGMFAGDRSRKETLVRFGFRLPSALDNRPLNFGEFETMAKNILYVSATPSDYELEQTPHLVKQIVRPTGLLDPVVEVRPSQNQIEDLSNEIRLRAQANERVLITTLTKKMAEDLTDYLKNKGLQVEYLHSEISSLDRTEIIRDLRKGSFDALVGINLLREGLDLPEVSLVAILDADKEGFLRSRKSLIQTIGRAARNANGKAIFYADKITDSMQATIEETENRRKIQIAFNKEHGITPQTIRKEVVDIIDREKKVEEAQQDVLVTLDRKKFKSKKLWKKAVEKEMLQAAKQLDFEKAAFLRDLLFGDGEEALK